MRKDLYKRAAEIAQYVIDTGATVRAAAKKYGISRSTCFLDLTQRLAESNITLHDQVSEVFAKNKAERHLRGGLSTKAKYAKEHENRRVALKKPPIEVDTQNKYGMRY